MSGLGFALVLITGILGFFYGPLWILTFVGFVMIYLGGSSKRR
jgi:hypothetical protein